MQPLITIAILNYNGFKYIEKTLSRILQLKYKNKEIIVLDNGSTDNSIDYLQTLNNIKFIRNAKNYGYSIGKNQLVNASHGEYIFLLDEDIYIENLDMLTGLIDQYSADTGFIQPLLVDINSDTTTYYGLFASIYGINMHKSPITVTSIQNYKQKMIPVEGGTGGCLFFKKDRWLKLGGYDESQIFNIDDIDLGPRSIIYGYKNYLFTGIKLTHLGVNNINNINKLSYSNRFKLIFSGHARAVIKNYTITNIIKTFPILYIYHLFKSLKFSLKRKEPAILIAFIYSNILFIKNLRNTLKLRKIIQKRRTETRDIFLDIKIPQFD